MVKSMNREPYGEKCKCGHYESEHVKKLKEIEHPALAQAKTMYGLLPLSESKIQYKNCKVCSCNLFIPEKKGWGFFK